MSAGQSTIAFTRTWQAIADACENGLSDHAYPDENRHALYRLLSAARECAADPLQRAENWISLRESDGQRRDPALALIRLRAADCIRRRDLDGLQALIEEIDALASGAQEGRELPPAALDE